MEISNLPADIIRETALNLPLRDIFKFCQTNKKFNKAICQYKPFWHDLFLKTIDENIPIPNNASIRWYQDKLLKWPDVKTLATLIRQNEVHSVEYINDYNANWNSFELVDNIFELNCSKLGLTSLPSM